MGIASGQRSQLKALEGRQVSVALRDGSRLDDCQLVSIGRNRARSLWLVREGSDMFVAVTDIADLCEAGPAGPREATNG